MFSLQVNPEVVPELEKRGLHFVGQDETQKRMEIMELPGAREGVGWEGCEGGMGVGGGEARVEGVVYRRCYRG